MQYVKPTAVARSIPIGPVSCLIGKFHYITSGSQFYCYFSKQTDGVEAAEACLSNSSVKQKSSRTLSAKRIERGKEAIKRVKTRREHQALLSELAGLVRQQATLRSFVPEPEEVSLLI